MERNKMKISTSQIVGIGVLTAIVVVLQFVSMMMRFGAFSITLTLIPIVVGAALYGKWAGAWLGFAFGVAVLLTGDANAFMAINAPGTIITVLGKGALSGLCAGLVYYAISKKNQIAAVIAAAAAAPIVNTGVFALGCMAFFLNTEEVKAWANGTDMMTYLFVGLIGLNFFIELGINLVLNPAIVSIIKIGKKIVKQ